MTTGVEVSIAIFAVGVIFWLGYHKAKIDSLEKWRDNIRTDMHEISDLIQGLSQKIAELTTLIEERTNRREFKRS